MMKTPFISLIILTIFQFSACSFFQQTNAEKNDQISSSTENPLPANKASENFRKDWKGKFDTIAAELERNRCLWQDSKINDYDFVVSKEGPGSNNPWRHSPVFIKVRSGQKNSIELVPDDEKAVSPTTDGFEDFDTIDKLFAYLKNELQKGSILEVKYDKKTGFPKDTVIAFSNEIHGYNNIQISNLQIAKAAEKGR